MQFLQSRRSVAAPDPSDDFACGWSALGFLAGLGLESDRDGAARRPRAERAPRPLHTALRPVQEAGGTQTAHG
jgi:hypothetical protein